MKTAKPPQPDSGPSSSRRAQPVRQTRANPPRTTSGLSRTSSGRESLGGGHHGHGHDQPIDIFPAITHFTDAITALPKDLVRHFTLLKEVDAKIFAPEEALSQLVDAALNSNSNSNFNNSNPPDSRLNNDASSSVAPVSTPASAHNSAHSATGVTVNGNHPPGSSTDENYHATVFDSGNIPRRQLFRQTAYKIQEMLVSLEEKNHVIATANDALSKQLGRIDDIWPHLEAEFSDEAKWGSTTHWAYPENRLNRANQAERTRRDAAANLTAAAQHLAVADEAAARSDARKQAVLAKKGLKNQQHQDSDADDHEHNKQKPENTKKSQGGGSKSRKTADAAATPVGLGISGAATTNGGNPPSKRRKVENNKTANNGQAADRAMSSVFGNNNTTKAKTSSPRATPAPTSEPPKKRKALPTSNTAAKKSKTANAAAAAATLSPTIGPSLAQPNDADPKNSVRNSPAPSTASARPASSRARGNSIQSTADQSRQRPASSASSRPNGITTAVPDLAATPNGAKSTDTKPTKEPTVPIKTDPAAKEEASSSAPAAPPPAARANSAGGASARRGSTAKPTDAEAQKAEVAKTPTPITTTTGTTTTTSTVTTTKSGRASKPSTPALGTFPDTPAPRSRNARNAANTASNTNAGTAATTPAPSAPAKRSHKKGAAQQLQLQQQQQQQALATAQQQQQPKQDEEVNNSSAQDEEEEDGDMDADPNEPRYCYCNSVSYGAMIACDSANCSIEWFHLDCVGLKDPPEENMKWYCNNCKDRMKSGKKANGR